MLKHFRFFAAEVWILIVSTLESLNVASQRLTNLCGFVTYSIKLDAFNQLVLIFKIICKLNLENLHAMFKGLKHLFAKRLVLANWVMYSTKYVSRLVVQHNMQYAKANFNGFRGIEIGKLYFIRLFRYLAVFLFPEYLNCNFVLVKLFEFKIQLEVSTNYHHSSEAIL